MSQSPPKTDQIKITVTSDQQEGSSFHKPLTRTLSETEKVQEVITPQAILSLPVQADTAAGKLNVPLTEQYTRQSGFNRLKLDELIEGFTNVAEPLNKDQIISVSGLKSNNYDTVTGHSLKHLHSKTELHRLLSQDDIWIDLFNPTAATMMQLASLYNIHPLTVEDCEFSGTREKVDYYPNYTFLSYTAFVDESDCNLDMIVFPKLLITVHHENPLTNLIESVKARLSLLNSFMRVSSSWIGYCLLDCITDFYYPLVNYAALEVDAIDDLVLEFSSRDQSDMLRRISGCRKKVINLQRRMQSKNEMLKTLFKRLPDHWQETVLYLGDIQDHVMTLSEQITSMYHTINNSHGNYLAMINIELTKASNESNNVMAKLTAVAGILLPINLITGLFGMNVRVPAMVNYDETYTAFIIILLLIVFLVVMGYLFIYRPLSKNVAQQGRSVRIKQYQ